MATSQGGPTAYTLSLDGTIQNLASVLPADTVESSLRTLVLQARGANGAPIYIGGAAVSSSAHGFSIPAGAGGVAAAPIQLQAEGSQLFLSDLYVLGTGGEFLQILAIPTNPVR